MTPARLIFSVALGLFAIARPGKIRAQINTPLRDYVVRHWNTAAPAPSANIRSIKLLRSGHIAVGLERGALRFDGIRFSPIPGIQSLEVGSVRGIHEDADATLWLAGSGGLVRVQDGMATVLGTPHGLTAAPANSVCRTAGQPLWVATGIGIARGTGDRFEYVARTPTWDLACDKDGSVWSAGQDGSLGHHSPTGEPLNGPESTKSLAIRSLHFDDSHRLWLGLRDGGIARIDNNSVIRPPGHERLPPVQVRAILSDRAGNVWIATWGAGLWRISRDGSVRQFDRDDGLGSVAISAVLEDHEGNIWAGGSAGLSRLRGTQFTKAQRLPEGIRAAISGSPAGVLVATDGGGIARVPWTGDPPVAADDSLPQLTAGRRIFSVASDQNGDVFFSDTDGVVRFSGTSVHRILTGGGDGRLVTVLQMDGKGSLWAAGETFQRLRRGRDVWETIPTTGGRTPGHFRAPTLDANDWLYWIGIGGIWTVKDDHLVLAVPAPELDTLVVLASATSSGNIFWLATNKGLVRVRKEGVAIIGATDGLPDAIAMVCNERDRFLWLGGEHGLYRVRIDAISENINLGSPGAVLRFGAEDGPVEPSFSFVGTRSLMAPDGRLWFASNDDIIVVDPRQIHPNAFAPPVSVEAMFVDGQVLPLGRTINLSLRPNPQRIDLEFTALALGNPEAQTLQYRLDGFDGAQWHNGRDRRAVFTNLAPGRYRFRVRAANEHGYPGNKEAEVAFEIPPTAWQRTSVRVAVSFSIVVLCALIFARFRTRRERLQFAAVMSERNRIASEMHDALEQSFAALALNLGAAEREAGSAVAKHLTTAQKILRHLHSETRHHIWDLHERQDGLIETLKRLVQDIGQGATLQAELLIVGSPLHCSEHIETQLLRIAQEAIANVMKHAAATRLQVKLEYGSQSVELKIADNGRGFQNTDVSPGGHYGLRNLGERVQKLGGTLKIESSQLEKRGTTITVAVPIKRESNA